jgi:hypothetical protein
MAHTRSAFMQANTRIVVALEQFKGLFYEQPDTRLSLTEAHEFCGLDEHVCGQLLGALVDVRFLARGRDGAFERRAPLVADEFAMP